MYLWWEGVLGIAICCVQKYSIRALECGEVRILQQMLPKTHVSTVYIFLAIWQLKQKLHCTRAVVGVYQYDLDTCMPRMHHQHKHCEVAF